MAGGVFKKGLSDAFVDALQVLAGQNSWWSDVLADKALLIAVRNEYLNVYWRGQSLFNVQFKNKTITAMTHPKYLLDPALSKLVSFDGSAFDVGILMENGFIKSYASPDTLTKMKTAAGGYASVEKKGVHVIATSNPAVVDVEIALSTSTMEADAIEQAKAGHLPRIDIATFREGSQGPELMFWEAKDFDNKELRANEGDPPVVAQIEKYRATLSHHHDDVVSSYKRVARNLKSLADMSRGARSIPPIVSAVADGADLHLDPAAAVGLVIFGFDNAQKNDVRWKELHLKKLEASGKERVKAAGDPKSIRL